MLRLCDRQFVIAGFIMVVILKRFVPSLTTDYCINDGYVEKQPVARKSYFVED